MFIPATERAQLRLAAHIRLGQPWWKGSGKYVTMLLWNPQSCPFLGMTPRFGPTSAELAPTTVVLGIG